jgi:hypothetical protein
MPWLAGLLGRLATGTISAPWMARFGPTSTAIQQRFNNHPNKHPDSHPTQPIDPIFDQE